jgi:predicted nucleotidyltransferase
MKTAAREKILQEELERIVKILTQKYWAQKIILFGSLAEGHQETGAT